MPIWLCTSINTFFPSFQQFCIILSLTSPSQLVLVVKNPVQETGKRHLISVPGLRRSPGGGCGKPLWHSCLENPMDRGTWRASIHGVAVGHDRVASLFLSFFFGNVLIALQIHRDFLCFIFLLCPNYLEDPKSLK